MADARMKALIGQHDEYVQYRQKLADYHFAEELLNLFNDLPTRLKHEKTDTAKFHDRIKECKKLKHQCWKIIAEEVTKSFIKIEDHHKNDQALLNNYHVKEFHDFALFLKNRSKSNENCIDLLKSENDHLKHELEALKLHYLALTSNLKLAHDSLNEKKLQCERIESERNNLEYLLLKYQQKSCQLEEKNETTTQASCDASNNSIIESDSDSEDNLDKNSSSDTCGYDELPISPPFGFRDEGVSSVKNIDPHELFSKKQDDYVETNMLVETSNSSVWRKLRERVRIQSSNKFAIETASLLPTPVNEIPLQTNLVDFNIDAIDVFENSTIDPCIQKLPVPLKMNENLAPSPNTSNQRMRYSVSQTIQPIFTCGICGKSFLKKSGLICHMRLHTMNSNQFLHCEKCGESFVAKRKGQKILECPNCDIRYVTCSRENEMESTNGFMEMEKNGESVDVDNIHKDCNNGSLDKRCDVCGKRYSRNYDVYRHIRQVHEKVKPYECNKCGKRFARKGHLKTHALVHGSKKPFKCSVCKVGFKYPSAKKRHEQLVHEGCAHLQCAHCDKQYGRKDHLISHIHTQHFFGFQKQFKCKICDKSFVFKQRLQLHKFTHSSKRSFKCSVCDLYFKSPRDKTQHEKTVHGKGGHFRCKHCDKVYKHKAFLIRHFRKDHVESDEWVRET